MNMRRLLLLMLVPTLAFGQQAYYGTRATSVRLSAEADPAHLERLPIKVGDIITPQNVREAIKVLFATGSYKTIEVDAASADGGTQLTFNVTAHYFFSTFTLEPPKILDRPLSSVVRLPVGQKVSETRLQEVLDQTTKVLKDAGYLNISVTSTPAG